MAQHVTPRPPAEMQRLSNHGPQIALDDTWIGEDEPRRRLSFFRVLLALILVAGIGYGGFVLVRSKLVSPVPIRKTWFAPYVDVTVPPVYQFQSTSDDPARQTVLGFVVDSPTASQPCTPTWGAAYTLRGADQSLTLGSRIAQMQQDGAQPIVSFGGEAHTSLDVSCGSVPALVHAYQLVISKYHLSTIDLDIEGAALDDVQAGQRRASAIADLQREARADGKQLVVWLTLPVEPSGLQDNALSVIAAMLANRVAIAGINLMTMDYTNPPTAGQSMLGLTEDALYASHTQLIKLLTQYGEQPRSAQVWQQLGATAMIGQNDVRGEIFTVADAHGLSAFARKIGLGRVSIWSLNRDAQCGTSFPEIGLQSNHCSGTAEKTLQFASTFNHLPGQASAFADLATAPAPVQPDTNPADAPYPLWSAGTQYPAGYKVVEHGEIYAAKWYNSGDDPAAVVQFAYETPWELIGPVLPGDHAPVIRKLPVGTYPAWKKTTSYTGGAKVLYQGLPYQAKWDNQGVSPSTEADNPVGSPWRPLFKIPGEPAVN
ncbi:MAG TPA: chitinase [Streptosporangiaceae bacterium]|nr:chitinase [Streptosporangiaceae bacterium]